MCVCGGGGGGGLQLDSSSSIDFVCDVLMIQSSKKFWPNCVSVYPT